MMVANLLASFFDGVSKTDTADDENAESIPCQNSKNDPVVAALMPGSHKLFIGRIVTSTIQK
jgi:hypothetical protein